MNTQTWWPDITDRESAKKAAMQGVAAAGFVSIITAIVSLGGWFGLGRGALLDAVLFAGIALGIKAMSRVAAIFGAGLFFVEKVYAIGHGAGASGIVMAIFLMLMFIAAVRGTIAFHQMKPAPASNGVFIPPKFPQV